VRKIARMPGPGSQVTQRAQGERASSVVQAFAVLGRDDEHLLASRAVAHLAPPEDGAVASLAIASMALVRAPRSVVKAGPDLSSTSRSSTPAVDQTAFTRTAGACRPQR
jgi:hypothetical protein